MAGEDRDTKQGRVSGRPRIINEGGGTVRAVFVRAWEPACPTCRVAGMAQRDQPLAVGPQRKALLVLLARTCWERATSTCHRPRMWAVRAGQFG